MLPWYMQSATVAGTSMQLTGVAEHCACMLNDGWCWWCWCNRCYKYRVTVFCPWTNKIEVVEANDPYSRCTTGEAQ